MENKQAVKYVNDLVKRLLPEGTITVHQKDFFNYHFNIEAEDERVEIIFGRDIMDDFEVALSEYTGTSYYNTIESAVKFQVYIPLGQEGLIPSFDISTEILNEKRDWAEDIRINVNFNKDFCNALNSGLQKLIKFLEETLSNYKDLDLSIFKEDKEYISSLLEYYKENHSFTSTGVSVRSLGYLKTAALCEIIDQENKKKGIGLPATVRKAIDKRIYSIVSTLRKPPFLEISLPKCAYDYASHYMSKAQRDAEVKQAQLETGILLSKSKLKDTWKYSIKELIKTIQRKEGNEETGSAIAKWEIRKEEFVRPFEPDSERLYECFVIMPIGKEGTEERTLNDTIFFNIIKPSIENSGFNITCSHAGLIGMTGSIPAQIIEKLYKSDIVVADLRGHNPNVMWELGVRHAFLKRSILICSDMEEIEKVFDVSVFRVIPYYIDGSSNQDFFKKICSCVQEIIANPTKSDNPVWDHRPVKYKTPSIFLVKATIDDTKTNYQAYYQGGNHMKINFSIIFDNESPEKNYLMGREFLLLNFKEELIGVLNIAGETPLIDNKDELGLVAKVFQKGMILLEDSPVPWDFEAHIRLDNVKKKIDIKEKDELLLSCNFIPRNGSSFSAGTVKFPVIFSR